MGANTKPALAVLSKYPTKHIPLNESPSICNKTEHPSLFIIYIFFNLVLCPFRDYFSSYETGQSIGGAKTGEPPRKTTWHTRKQNLACLPCGQLRGSNPHQTQQ